MKYDLKLRDRLFDCSKYKKTNFRIKHFIYKIVGVIE